MQKKILKKLAYSKEPKLHVHKYVVAINKRIIHKNKKSFHVRTKYHYCVNLKEVWKIVKESPKGTWTDVFSASHNFIQGYAQE